MWNGSALHSPMKDLRHDLQAVARDAEALVKATANVTSDHVQEARTRTQDALQTAFDNLYNRRMQRRVRKLARNTDTYVRDHPWSIIGAAAGVALLVGLLTRRD